VLLDEAAELVDDVVRAGQSFTFDPLDHARLDERVESFATQLGSFPAERLQHDQAIELFLRVKSRLLDVRTLVRRRRATEGLELAHLQLNVRDAAKRMAAIAGSFGQG
jgi:hypothetical protein